MLIPDAIDRRIIEATQTGLPLVAEPYNAIAEQLGISEEQVLQRMQAMQENCIIRRMGAIPNHYKLGFHGNGMSVWDIPDELITETGREVGALEYVSHCYERPRMLPVWPYNMFAMVHGRDHQEVLDKVQSIAELLNGRTRGHDILFSKRILKKTGLRIATAHVSHDVR